MRTLMQRDSRTLPFRLPGLTDDVGLFMHGTTHSGCRELHLQHQDVQLACMFSSVPLCLLRSRDCVAKRPKHLSAC